MLIKKRPVRHADHAAVGATNMCHKREGRADERERSEEGNFGYRDDPQGLGSGPIDLFCFFC